jgi:hypothetical protein
VTVRRGAAWDDDPMRGGVNTIVKKRMKICMLKDGLKRIL